MMNFVVAVELITVIYLYAYAKGLTEKSQLLER